LAFLSVSQESIEKAAEGNSSYIKTSGIYDLNLRAAEVKPTTNGATQVNYIFNNIMSYGNTVVNKQGKRIFGMDILEGLAATLGEEVLSDPEPTDVKFKTQTKSLNCIPELTDVDVKAWIAFEYRIYNGEIQENVSVKRFYRAADGASGSEVLSGKDIGTQLAKDEKYASEVKYSDGLDEAAVEAWKKAKADGNSSTTTPAPATNSAPTFPGMGN